MFYYLVILCLFLVWRLWCKKHSSLDPPELSGKLPIIGHSHRLIGDGRKLYHELKRFAVEAIEKGGVITLSLGPRKVYGITDPTDSLTIMNSSLEKHYMYDFVKPLIGNGLFTADESTWKKNRKLLSPAYHQQVLNGYIDVFNTQAQSLVDQFTTRVGKPFDHEQLLRLNNLKTICLTSFGVSTEEYNDIQNQYLPLFSKFIKRVNERIQKFWLHSDFIYNMTQEKKLQDIEIRDLLALSKTIIQNKKMEKENLTNTESKGKFTSFIHFIMDLANDTGCFTDDQIREETDTVILAGHDTTASTLTFALTVLGSHPDVQEKAYEEIQNVLGNSEKNIDKNDLSKLVYVEAIIKETLRLYPIFPILARRINKDVKLRNYTLKANSECFISFDGVHRHSIWGPDADEYRPERWLKKETLPNPKYFGPFGLGKRFCIGKVYAMMSMKIILAHLIRKFYISSDVSKMVLKVHAMTRPESGHYITLAHRNISPRG